MTKQRILIVEDEALIARLISSIVEDAGFEVVGPVGSVKNAFALIEQFGCDAAILDVMLRGETAEPVARVLLDQGKPILVVSANPSERCSSILKSLPTLSKPFNVRELIEKLKNCMGMSAE